MVMIWEFLGVLQSTVKNYPMSKALISILYKNQRFLQDLANHSHHFSLYFIHLGENA